jgi:hypothetical protein
MTKLMDHLRGRYASQSWLTKDQRAFHNQTVQLSAELADGRSHWGPADVLVEIAYSGDLGDTAAAWMPLTIDQSEELQQHLAYLNHRVRSANDVAA